MFTCHGIIWLIQHLTDVYLPWDHLVNTTLNRCLLAWDHLVNTIIWLIQHLADVYLPWDHLVNTTLNRCLLAMGSFGQYNT